MAGPTFDHPDLGSSKDAQGSDLDDAPRSTGLRRDLEHRLRGQSRRQKNGISSKSEHSALLFEPKAGRSNFAPAMRDDQNRHRSECCPPEAHKVKVDARPLRGRFKVDPMPTWEGGGAIWGSSGVLCQPAPSLAFWPPSEESPKSFGFCVN